MARDDLVTIPERTYILGVPFAAETGVVLA